MIVANKSSKKHSRALLNLLAFAVFVVIHLVSLASLLDVYFSSTVVQNVNPVEWSSNPDSRRLVLFVSDGLRADKFFEFDERKQSRAPFLRNVISNKAIWGVSHTRAPTESRPAHIAMLGGFYEDPYTIRTYFQRNLIEFDTVLNESKEAWSYGAYDVVPFFNKGTAADHVHATAHHYNMRRLADVDKWVYDKLQALFQDAKTNTETRKRLQSDKIVFFLHMAGVDTNGHAFHPGSKQYLDNIKEMDDIVRKSVDLFESFYENDGKTTYVFTGDHGMTDPGGHGGGSENETRTPFIVWGPGINKNQERQREISLSPSQIAETKKWGLDPTTRRDVQQIDVSVLMAAQIGVPYPVNSVGKLPLEYLAEGHSKAEKAFGRARQAVETLETKKSQIKQNYFYLYFWKYQNDEEGMTAQSLQDIEKLIENKQYEAAISKSSNLAEFAIVALSYYHSFSHHVPFICVMISIIGWIILAVSQYVTSRGVCHIQYSIPSFRYSLVSAAVFVILLLRLHSFQSGWVWYVYLTVPFCLWYYIISNIKNIINPVISIVSSSIPYFIRHFVIVVLWLILTIAGFYNRKYFSVVALGLLAAPGINGFKMNRKLGLLWILLCIALSIFPTLPVMTSTSSSKRLIFVAGVFGQLICIFFAIYHKIFSTQSTADKGRTIYFIKLLSVLFPTVVLILAFTYVNEAMAIVIVVAGWILPLFCSPNSFQRLTVVYSLHMSLYLLISISHDAIFFVVFTTLLHLWTLFGNEESVRDENILLSTNVHARLKDEKGEQTRKFYEDYRSVCMLLSFLTVSFFSLYSIDGLNHFHPTNGPLLLVTSSRRQLVVFVYKLLLQVLAILIAYHTSMKKRCVSISSHWYLLSTLCDVLFIVFYLSVKTSGSWMEIALSVVNVCVAVGIPLVVAVSLLLSRTLVELRIFS